MKKGDILKFGNHKIRGLKNNCYFYCKELVDDEPMFVRCIITQSGEILISSDFVDISSYKKDLVPTTVEEFVEHKYDFINNTVIDFVSKEYNNGIIRNINKHNGTLTVEVENEDTAEYDNIIIKFDDVILVYPEFTQNERRKFKPLLFKEKV